MNRSSFDCRTVAIVRDLRTEVHQGANGTYESKDILVRIAVDRDYKVTRQENGKTISEYATDYWLAKFTGKLAQAFADHCSGTKENGKLQSRHLWLEGNFENYTNTRKVTKQINIGGQLYEVEFDVENNFNTIFVVNSMKFLDKNPNANNAQQSSGNGVTSITPIGTVAQPVAQAMPVVNAQVAPVVANTAPQSIPVVSTQVAQPVAQAVPVAQTVPVAQVAQSAEAFTAMPAPVVDPNFVPAGATAPF